MSKSKPQPTPAARAKARRDPAVGLPTPPPRTERNLAGLHIRVAGVPYLIGPRLRKSGCELMLTMEGASELRLAVDDPDAALVAALSDEAMRLNDGVRVILDDITYVLRDVNASDDGGLDLLFEDEVAWRLRQFTRYMAKSRNRITRPGFIKLLVDEASRAPLAPMRAFIPELTDPTVIAPAVAE